MPTLEEDLERIAALRGLPTNFFVQAQTEVPVPRDALALVFDMPHDARDDDFAAYDRLPEFSRRIISECPLPINCMVYRHLLMAVPNEERVANAVADLFPRRMKHWLLRHYDRDHPNLRKYG